MLISTKGTYAIRVLVDLALNGGENNFISITEISKRLNISRKYLESIMTLLSKNNIIDVCRGKNGGYKLNKKPKDYKLIDILCVTEDGLAPVPCLRACDDTCNLKETCTALETWKELQDLINKFFDSKTIFDLVSACQK